MVYSSHVLESSLRGPLFVTPLPSAAPRSEVGLGIALPFHLPGVGRRAEMAPGRPQVREAVTVAVRLTWLARVSGTAIVSISVESLVPVVPDVPR